MMDFGINYPMVLDFDFDSITEWAFYLYTFKEQMSVFGTKKGKTWCIDQLENINSLGYVELSKKNVDTLPYMILQNLIL